MTTPRPQPISYNGDVVAHATAASVWLAPELDGLALDDPIVRFVAAKCRYVHAIERGAVPGPYDDGAADVFARSLLLPDDEFAAIQGHGDAELGERFGVPVEQIALKRLDLFVASFRVL